MLISIIDMKENRPLRDLLRKRSLLVKTSTQYQVSFINFVNRNLGINISGNDVKKLSLSMMKMLRKCLKMNTWCYPARPIFP
jgi:hypothetical protein